MSGETVMLVFQSEIDIGASPGGLQTAGLFPPCIRSVHLEPPATGKASRSSFAHRSVC
jgi:hypothetical protein